ncbi:MAG: hypothetical protein R2731_09295 [Nocardioides sp.]
MTRDHSPRPRDPRAGRSAAGGLLRRERRTGSPGASAETAELLADLVVEDVRTLAFVRSRRGAEQVAMTAAALVGEVAPSCRPGWRPTAAGTSPRSVARSRRRCAPAS